MSGSVPIRKILFFISLGLSTTVFGAEITNTQLEKQVELSLTQELTAFIKPLAGAAFEVNVRPLTNKKQLTCNQPVKISEPASSRAPVGIVKRIASCSEHWRIILTADVEVFVPAVHSTKSLARGETLDRNDLQLKKVPYNKLRGQYYASFNPLDGRRLKRTVTANKLITSNMLEPDFLVRKGDSVMIQAGSEGLQVSMPGIALEDGSLRENIQVRNRSSGKVIDARVISEGKVSILF